MPEVADEAIIRQIKEWADDLADQVPPWIPEAGQHRHPPASPSDSRTSTRFVFAAAAALVIVVAGLAVMWRSGRDTASDLTAGNGSTMSVAYEKVAYRQSASLNCTSGPLPEGGFDEATFETWGDQSGLRWRNGVTYPDGSERSLIALGVPWYPTDLYAKGDLLGRAPGCIGTGVLVAEPGQNTFFSLNPPTHVPTIDEVNGQTSSPEGSMPAVPGYRDLGVPVPGEHVDSQGRTADLWRQTVTGFVGDGSTQQPVVQTTDWLVDSNSGDVLEKSYTYTIEGVGTATSSLTLITSGVATVDVDWFDTDGYNPVE